MSSMSRYMQKGKSSNFTSASTALVNNAMRTPALTRSRSIVPPNAPFKAPRPLHRDVEQSVDVTDEKTGAVFRINEANEPVGLELRRTYSALPGSGQIGGFIMGPQAGAMLGMETPLPPKKRVVSPSTERMTRSRSPTLANINEALSPRTDFAVEGLKSLSQEDAVLSAIDSDGTVNVDALNANTILNATKENARAKYMQALKNLDDAATNCLSIEGANWPSSFHEHLKSTNTWSSKALELHAKALELQKRTEVSTPPVERQCTGCLTNEPNQMAHSCLGFASAENSQEEIEPLNRSFTPDIVMPKVGDYYVRKARDGSPYPWVEQTHRLIEQTGRTLLYEFMKQGHRVKVVHVFPKGMHPGLYFQSLDGGICTHDMHQHGYNPVMEPYYAQVEDFYKHMELVTEEPDVQKPTSSVEQKSGGTLGGRKGVNKLTGVNSNKRKAVENPEEDNCSTPTKQKKVSVCVCLDPTKNCVCVSPTSYWKSVDNCVSPTKYWKSVDKIREQEAIMLQIQKQVHGKRRSVRLPRNITYDGTNTRHAVEGVNRNGVTSPLRSPTNLSRSISWQNDEDIKTLRELQNIGC